MSWGSDSGRSEIVPSSIAFRNWSNSFSVMLGIVFWKNRLYAAQKWRTRASVGDLACHSLQYRLPGCADIVGRHDFKNLCLASVNSFVTRITVFLPLDSKLESS